MRDNGSRNGKGHPRVVVVGAGFGGLRAARALKGEKVSVTLVDRNNFHLFQPLLYQVATASISPLEIGYPVRGIFRRQRNFNFRLAEVQRVDFDNHWLETSAGPIRYDYLILAPGGETNYFGSQSVERNAFDLKGMDDAIAIRNHLLAALEQAALTPDPEQRAALLTFVVVGGGPTGVEMAGSLAELIKIAQQRDFPYHNLGQPRVLLVEGTNRILPGMPVPLSQYTTRTLRRKGVEVMLGGLVTGYDGQTVQFKSGQQVMARTLIWAAGVQAAGLARELPAEKGKQGRVKVLPTLQLPDRPEVFVIGDAAYLEDKNGQPLPMVAPVAMQQAERAAENAARLVRGEPPQPFRYKDPGTLATIGRNQAVAQLGRLRFKGFTAWVVWLVVHIMQLIGFRNRLIVMINWAWEYIFLTRAVRLIVPGSRARPEESPGAAEVAQRLAVPVTGEEEEG